MSASSKCAKFLLGAFLLAGCDDKKNAAAPPPDEKTKTPAADETPRPADVPKTTSQELPKTTTDNNPKPPTAVATPTVRERGTILLTNLKSAIDRGKLADADACLKQLEAMKDQLPGDLSAKLDKLRDAYKAWPTGAPR